MSQDFDIDLEGAQTVRILCYRMNRDVGAVIGTCAMEVSAGLALNYYNVL